MFHIKIKLDKSKISGIGLFADENIKKDQIIYSINNKIDLLLTIEEFFHLSKNEQNTIRHYGYVHN